MRHIAQQFRTRRFRAGGYTTFAAAIVIAIAVAVNLLAGALPESVTKQDLTQAQIYTLSDQTRRIVSALEKDVTLYQVAVTGSENDSIQALLRQQSDDRGAFLKSLKNHLVNFAEGIAASIVAGCLMK